MTTKRVTKFVTIFCMPVNVNLYLNDFWAVTRCEMKEPVKVVVEGGKEKKPFFLTLSLSAHRTSAL